MPSKITSLTDDQLFYAAVAYETCKCELPLDEFLLNVSNRYLEIGKTYKQLHKAKARTGSKDKLGL